MNTKLQFRLLTLLVISFFTGNVFSQIHYSTFNSPQSGTDYSFSTGGLCIGCSMRNPSNAASMSKTDSASIYMTVGLLNKICIRLRLQDTSSYSVGVVVKNNTGLLNASLLSGIVIKAYFKGNLVKTLSGGSLLTLSLLSGSKQTISGVVNAKFDEVEFEVNNALSALWDINVFYAFGTDLTPLPVKLEGLKVERSDIAAQPVLSWYLLGAHAKVLYVVQTSEDGIHFTESESFEMDASSVAYNERKLNLSSAKRQYIRLLAREHEGGDQMAATVLYQSEMPANVNVWPNPGTGVFYVPSTTVYEQVQVLDQQGRTVYTFSAGEPVNLESCQAGIYTLLFVSSDNPSARALVRKY